MTQVALEMHLETHLLNVNPEMSYLYEDHQQPYTWVYEREDANMEVNGKSECLLKKIESPLPKG